ncbi:MAG: TonB-dependent receptor [Acidobacteria bacterium]|nr:TonB-dependent receptor [Acidobacteriota bacterium]
MAGDRPTVQALLEHLPAAQAPVAGRSAPLTAGGRTVAIPLGTLSGSSIVNFNDWQWSARVDHRFSDRHTLGGRYLYDDRLNSGDGQKTPPGLTTIQPQRRQAASAFLNSSFSPTIFNELRFSYQRFASRTTAANPAAERIPSMIVDELGLRRRLAAVSRTGIGLPDNLPRSGFSEHYQLQETIGVLRGPHYMKFGMDFWRRYQITRALSQVRGHVRYGTLQDLVNDVAQAASIVRPMPGEGIAKSSKFYEFFFFLQDEWRIHPDFTITYGLRYESPGNPFEDLRSVSDRIVAGAGGDQRFAVRPLPKTDSNNWAPRFGFSYRFGEGPGLLRWLTGAGKLVLRGGYSRSYDSPFLLATGDMRDRFPFALPTTLEPRARNAFQRIQEIRGSIVPSVENPDQLTRVTVSADFRSPYAEQFALQLQRELQKDWAVSLGWIATKGTALYQNTDGNPTLPGSRGTQRADPTKGVVATFCNCTSSIYHSLQTSLEKRLSNNFSMAAHYTWSAFIDGASDVLAASNTDVALSQDAFNRHASRARSSYDRPHRFTVNGVYELPLHQAYQGARGKILGGWQLSGFLTFQSGAPFPDGQLTSSNFLNQWGTDGGSRRIVLALRYLF